MSNSLVNAVVGEATYARVNGVKTVARSGLATISSREQPTSASNECYTIVQPTSTPGENLFTASPTSAGTYTDFLIPNLGNKVQDISLCISLKNAGGVEAAGVFSGFNIMNRVEYFSGTTLICNITPDFMNMSHLMLNPDTVIANQITATAIAVNHQIDNLHNGEAKGYILKVTGPFSGIYPNLIREQLRLRVHWAAEDTFFTPTGCKVTSPPVLLIESTALSPSDCASIMSQYNSNTFRHRFVEPRMITETKTLTPSSKFTVSLSNLNGIYSAFFLWIYPKVISKVASPQLTCSNGIDRTWLTDSNGSILQGGSELTIEQRQFMVSSSFPSTYFNTTHGKYVAPIIFSHRIHSDWSTGSCHGVQTLLSQGETLHFTTNTYVSPGDYIVNVMGLHMSGYRVQDARLISMR